MVDLILLILSAALINNLALGHLVGVTPLLATSRRYDVACGMALSVMIVLPLTTLATMLLQAHWLLPRGLEHLTLLLFVFTSALIMYITGSLLVRINSHLARTFRLFMPLLLTSNIVLGTALLNSNQAHGVLETVAFSLGSGLGFALLLLVFTSQRERLAAADIPLPFRGHAIAFLSLALTAMGFLGIAGLITI